MENFREVGEKLQRSGWRTLENWADNIREVGWELEIFVEIFRE